MGVVRKPTKSRKTIGESRREKDAKALDRSFGVEKGNDDYKTFDIESILFNGQPKFKDGMLQFSL